jgi:pyridoxal phosphate-dependent aminotransferase EpsN
MKVQKMIDTKKRIFLSPPHMCGEEFRLIQNAFDTNWIAPLGPHVDAFEAEMAEYIGIQHGVALSSGTAAIHLAIKCLGIKAGDTVFASSLTFVGTIAPLVHENIRLVFIDSDAESWNMCPTALEKALLSAKKSNRMPKAIITVNLYGQSARYSEILNLSESYHIPVIEDAAESLGAEYNMKKSGSFGVISILSFNGNKIITTSGGGMLLTNNEEWAKKSRFLATQARDPARHYQHSQVGFNYRLSNLLAAVGRGQLSVLDERVKARREIFNRYQHMLGDIAEITFMPELTNSKSNRWLTVIQLSPKAKVTPIEIMDKLEANNIESRPVWKPLHMQPVFSNTEYHSHNNIDMAKLLFERGICLPSGSNLNAEEQEYICTIIKKLLL